VAGTDKTTEKALLLALIRRLSHEASSRYCYDLSVYRDPWQRHRVRQVVPRRQGPIHEMPDHDGFAQTETVPRRKRQVHEVQNANVIDVVDAVDVALASKNFGT
jgi:hypothetical protein